MGAVLQLPLPYRLAGANVLLFEARRAGLPHDLRGMGMGADLPGTIATLGLLLVRLAVLSLGSVR